MNKIETVIQPLKLDDVKEALSAVGTQGLTVREVIGYRDRQELPSSTGAKNMSSIFCPRSNWK
jgi:nitrogen regulatory protein PII